MSRPFIELGLSSLASARPGVAAGMMALVDRLLAVLSDTALEDQALGTDTFRQQLAECRTLLTGIDADALPEVGQRCVGVCETYLEGLRRHAAEREHEFTALTSAVRDTLETLAGGAQRFRAQLAGSSDRIGQLVDLHDVRELRRQLAAEVAEIQRAIAEREKEEDACQAKLSTRIETLRARVVDATAQALLDPLTGTANRRQLDRTLEQWIALADRNAHRFALGIIDLDDFKAINDLHGHSIGDRVLVATGGMLTKGLRPTDLLARYGGDEFVLLLADVDLRQGEQILGDLIARLAWSPFEYQELTESVRVPVTMSAGLTDYLPGDRAEDLFHRADSGLYEAKRRGKNCVVSRRRSRFRNMLEGR